MPTTHRPEGLDGLYRSNVDLEVQRAVDQVGGPDGVPPEEGVPGGGVDRTRLTGRSSTILGAKVRARERGQDGQPIPVGTVVGPLQRGGRGGRLLRHL